MDPITGFVDGPRARDAFLLQVVMAPPWSLAVVDEAPLTVVAVLRGAAWSTADGGAPVRLGPGDVLLVRSPTRYVLASSPDLEPAVVIGPDQTCTAATAGDARGGEPGDTPSGADLVVRWRAGVRTWGNAADGPDALLVGTFRSGGEVGALLTGALPPSAVVRGPDDDLLRLLGREVSREGLGQSGVLDRLLDLLLIAAVRAWTASGDATAATWLTAGRDPVVREALRLLHQAPEQPWTVTALAVRVGVSRASLARRFRDAVGAPPMTHLTRLRLALAADLLDEGLTLAAIARRTGYADAAGLSAAFTRHHGSSPQAHRRARRRAASAPAGPG